MLLLEKGELTSGSTHHAAGLVTQFNPSSTMMRFRRYSVELYRELGVFEGVGSVRIASSEESLLELRRGASRAAGIGLEAELIGPAEVLERLPEAAGAPIFGAVWMPGDGHVDPHIATYAVADAARALGVEIRTAHARHGDRARAAPRGARRADRRPAGSRPRHVVNAPASGRRRSRRWSARSSRRCRSTTSTSRCRPWPGHEVPRDMPCFRDTDNLVYGKAEAGGLLFGGYEPDPVARWADGVPWDHGARPVASDMERFAPLMEGAIRRFPFLEDAGVVACSATRTR